AKKWQRDRTAQGSMSVFEEPFVTEDVLAVKLLPDITAGPSGALPDKDHAAEQRELSGLAQEAVSFAESMLAPGSVVFSEEMLGLANRAAEQCARRANEDVKSWAERLARDVSDATD